MDYSGCVEPIITDKVVIRQEFSSLTVRRPQHDCVAELMALHVFTDAAVIYNAYSRLRVVRTYRFITAHPEGICIRRLDMPKNYETIFSGGVFVELAIYLVYKGFIGFWFDRDPSSMTHLVMSLVMSRWSYHLQYDEQCVHFK